MIEVIYAIKIHRELEIRFLKLSLGQLSKFIKQEELLETILLISLYD